MGDVGGGEVEAMARPGLLRNRKFIRLSRAIDGQAVALGSLELLWSVAYESGDDVLGTPEDVEALADWHGEEGVLFAALRDAGSPDRPGFIEEVADRPGIWRVHDLWDHAPDYVRKRRSREVERQTLGAILRDSADADRSSTGRGPPFGRTPAPAPAPAPCLPSEDSSEPASPTSEPAPVVVFPCVGAGSKAYAVTEGACAEWASAFPAVDVKGEVRRMAAWLAAHPDRRKTARGTPAFVVRWLSKAQDAAPRSRAPGAASVDASRLAPVPASPQSDFKALGEGRHAL